MVFSDRATYRRFVRLARRRGQGALVERIAKHGRAVGGNGSVALIYRVGGGR